MRDKLTEPEIFFNIFKCLFTFYSVYFGCSSIMFAVYSLENFDGTIPFNYEEWIDFGNCCEYTREEMVNTLSMVVSFPISGALFGLIVLNWVWDYAITSTVIHFAISCIVTKKLPDSWTWWLCLGISLMLMIGCGELVSGLRRYRNRCRLIVPAPVKQEDNFLNN